MILEIRYTNHFRDSCRLTNINRHCTTPGCGYCFKIYSCWPIVTLSIHKPAASYCDSHNDWLPSWDSIRDAWRWGRRVKEIMIICELFGRPLTFILSSITFSSTTVIYIAKQAFVAARVTTLLSIFAEPPVMAEMCVIWWKIHSPQDHWL